MTARVAFTRLLDSAARRDGDHVLVGVSFAYESLGCGPALVRRPAGASQFMEHLVLDTYQAADFYIALGEALGVDPPALAVPAA